MLFTILQFSLVILLLVYSFPFNHSDEVGFLSTTHTDFMRTFAICIIVLMHSLCGAGLPGYGFSPLGGIGVSIFLMLSGYGLTVSWRKNGCRGFWKKKGA